MSGILHCERHQGWLQGVGDKLAAVWNELRRRVLSLARVDQGPEGNELAERPEPGANEAFDNRRASITSLPTLHSYRSRHRRGDEEPESPLPSVRAEFD